MRNGWRRFGLPAAAFAALLGGAVAAGCGAAGFGLGSLGLGLAALAGWLFLTATSSAGCSQRRAEACLTVVPSPADGSFERPPVGPCLSEMQVCLQPPPEPDADGSVEPVEDGLTPPLRPCLSRMQVCLQVPPPEVCLSVAPPDTCLSPTLEVCLEYVPPDVCLRVRPHPCLSVPRPVDAGKRDAAPVEPVAPCLGPRPTVCLSPVPHPCLRSFVPDPLSERPAPPAARDAAARLATTGILTAEQLRRLSRLRGEV